MKKIYAALIFGGLALTSVTAMTNKQLAVPAEYDQAIATATDKIVAILDNKQDTMAAYQAFFSLVDGLEETLTKKDNSHITVPVVFELRRQVASHVITDYDSCVAYGGPIMESFPMQCALYGLHFTFGKMSEQAKVDCEANGRKVVTQGRIGAEECVTPYEDGGEICTTSDECGGVCMVNDMEATQGTCQYHSGDIYGCKSPIEEKEQGILCID